MGRVVNQDKYETREKKSLSAYRIHFTNFHGMCGSQFALLRVLVLQVYTVGLVNS